MKKTVTKEILSVNNGVRTLECGHTQKVPKGGKAHLSTRAYCLVCAPKQKSAPAQVSADGHNVYGDGGLL